MFEKDLQYATGNKQSTPLQREAELVRDGFSTGVGNRIQELWNHPAEAALEFGVCAGLSAALRLMSKAGGGLGTTSRAAGWVLTGLMVGDLVRRTVPTVGAMVDTWRSGDNLEANKATVAQYAGSALVDYSLMTAGAFSGHSLTGKLSFSRAATVDWPSTPRHLESLTSGDYKVSQSSTSIFLPILPLVIDTKHREQSWYFPSPFPEIRSK